MNELQEQIRHNEEIEKIETSKLAIMIVALSFESVDIAAKVKTLEKLSLFITDLNLKFRGNL